jgi:release factor glutamine methyltransferase
MEQVGVDSPWLTALVLLEHATGIGREAVLAHPEVQPPEELVDLFVALVERRRAREPLAYILGYREFYGRRFAVTRETLIPRPETEQLVHLALDWLQLAPTAPQLLLDVGTGSGAIAITLLSQRPQLVAIATDVSLGALAVARENALDQEVERRLRLVACDLASAIGRTVPLVVANLPYVPTDAIPELEPEIDSFEPRYALDGGPDGMAIITSFLGALDSLLEPGGRAILEFGDGQGGELQARARNLVHNAEIMLELDAAGMERFLVVQSAP